MLFHITIFPATQRSPQVRAGRVAMVGEENSWPAVALVMIHTIRKLQRNPCFERYIILSVTIWMQFHNMVNIHTYIYIYINLIIYVSQILQYFVYVYVCIYIYIYRDMQRVFFPCQVSLLKAERWSCSPRHFLLSALPTLQMPAFSVKFRCPNSRWNWTPNGNPVENLLRLAVFFLGSPWIQEIPEFDIPKPWHNMFWQSNVVVERYPRSWGQHLWPNMRGEASISGFGCTPADYHGR